MNQIEAYDKQLEYIQRHGLENTPIAPMHRRPGINTLGEFVRAQRQNQIDVLMNSPGGNDYWAKYLRNGPDKYSIFPLDKDTCP